jgi:hypothetical protein
LWSRLGEVLIPLCYFRVVPERKCNCRAIIETPKNSRNKFDYDQDSGLFELGGLLPEGMLFPFDFGFIPGTLVKLLNTMLKKCWRDRYGRGSVRRSKHVSVFPSRAREQAVFALFQHRVKEGMRAYSGSADAHGKGDSGARERCPPPPFSRGKK